MGRFISTHSVVLVLPMNIDRLPDRGGSVIAAAAMSRPGGGFTTLSAGAAFGVRAALASPLGTGPNSFTVRQQLVEAGVQILTQELVGDIGVAIQLIESNGQMTSVVTAGVEAEPSRQALDNLVLQPGDVIHISGADLASDLSWKTLSGWGAALPASVRLVVSVAPAVAEVPIAAWRQLFRRADVVTMNRREATTLADRLAAEDPALTIRDLLGPTASIVHRMGLSGCEIQSGIDSPRVHVPAFVSETVDTAGVGDTHIAVMCAALLEGKDLTEACRWANAAASLTISQPSALPVPTRDQIEKVLREGKLIDSPEAARRL
ncbi:MAG: PfkB family carbohydrate kinase [Actinomycetaceae bacterium]|nr:PfkB family carbohydrate kinase [Actinomycetaceae bacterium]